MAGIAAKLKMETEVERIVSRMVAFCGWDDWEASDAGDRF